MSDDKRRAERYPVNDEFSRVGDGESMTFVSDLSENGVFVHTQQPLPIGELLDLRFTLVLDDPVVIGARGRVVRHSEGGMGVEFTDLSPDMVLRIHDALGRQRALKKESDKLQAQVVAAKASGDRGTFDDLKTGVFQVPVLDPSEIHDDDDDDD